MQPWYAKPVAALTPAEEKARQNGAREAPEAKLLAPPADSYAKQLVEPLDKKARKDAKKQLKKEKRKRERNSGSPELPKAKKKKQKHGTGHSSRAEELKMAQKAELFAALRKEREEREVTEKEKARLAVLDASGMARG